MGAKDLERPALRRARGEDAAHRCDQPLSRPHQRAPRCYLAGVAGQRDAAGVACLIDNSSMRLHYQRADYSVVVKNRAPPPKAWRATSARVLMGPRLAFTSGSLPQT